MNPDLSPNWMAWLALRHFLPVRLLRTLSSIVVKELSQGRLSLEDLVEETSIEAPLWNEQWVIRPLPHGSAYDRERGCALEFVRSIVWQSDDSSWASLGGGGDAASAWVAQLGAVAALGAADLNAPTSSFDRYLAPVPGRPSPQSSFTVLRDAVRVAYENCENLSPEDFWSQVDSATSEISEPLRTIMTKHIADLCADADRWDKALRGYEVAGERLPLAPPEWDEVAVAWRAAVTGSKAGALGIVETDPVPAVKAFAEELGAAVLSEAPVSVMSLAFEEGVAERRGAHLGAAEDRRVAGIHAPLLSRSHDVGEAIKNSLRGDYDDATRRFWSVLRRQLAIGAVAETAFTKAWYANSIFAELWHERTNAPRPEWFRMGATLLVESAKYAVVGHFPWKERGPLVALYVDDACVGHIIERAKAFRGTRVGRELVVIELFRIWAPLDRSPARRDTVARMIRHVAELAKEFPAEFESNKDVGRRGIKALRELAEELPEFRTETSALAADVICEHLDTKTKEFWAGAEEAIRLADAFVDALDEASLDRVVRAVVNRLEAQKTATNLWPVTRAAFRFLVCPSVTTYAKSHPELGRTILQQILRIGLEQESERRSVLYYLHDFDEALLGDGDVAAKLKTAGIVEELREGMRELNSSRVVDAIKPFFFVPSLVGRDGVADAFNSFGRILDSAATPNRSVGLAVAYQLALLLVHERHRIAAALPGQHEWLHERYREILAKISTLWEAAAAEPLVFEPFSLPPACKADPVVVHNWAFASLRFAEVFGTPEDVEPALRKAAENPELAAHIALARGTRAEARPIQPTDLADVRTLHPEAFYETLGRRLAQVAAAASADGVALCKVLVEQCLRFGPRREDAAVLLEAAHLGLHDHVRASGLADYRRRVDLDRPNRLLLGPLLDTLFRAASLS